MRLKLHKTYGVLRTPYLLLTQRPHSDLRNTRHFLDGAELPDLLMLGAAWTLQVESWDDE